VRVSVTSFVSEVCHHTNNEVDEIQRLNKELEERKSCVVVTARDLTNLWYV
jgi:hypothetical protein